MSFTEDPQQGTHPVQQGLEEGVGMSSQIMFFGILLTPLTHMFFLMKECCLLDVYPAKHS